MILETNNEPASVNRKKPGQPAFLIRQRTVPCLITGKTENRPLSYFFMSGSIIRSAACGVKVIGNDQENIL